MSIKYPSRLPNPVTLADVKNLVESWRMTPFKKVPVDVKVIMLMHDALMEAVSFNEHLSLEVKALEGFIDRQQRAMQMWPDMVANYATREAMSALHREAIEMNRQRERQEHKKLAEELVAVSE